MKASLRAKHTEYAGIRFDSSAEASFYACLKAKFKGEIICQYPIDLLPPSGNFKSITWKADFALVPIGWATPRLIIEYKGGWVASNRNALELFKLKMHLYSLKNPFPLIITGDKVAEKSIPNHMFTSLKLTLEQVFAL